MYWAKITGNLKVVELLKKREEIEKEIRQIDSKALINYELEKLAEPQANGAKTGDDKCHMQNVSISLPEAFGEWILMCCYEPNGLDGWIRWYDVNYDGEKDEKIYTTKELFEQFKDFSEKCGEGNSL